MRLSIEELRALDKVLKRIDEDQSDPPLVNGAVGQYLREVSEARSGAVDRLGLDSHRSHSFSGEKLMPQHLVPIAPLQLKVRGDVLGSVTSAVVANETMATTMHVTLWGSAQGASRLLRMWREKPRAMIEVSGDYRWHPPARITPGRPSLHLVSDPLPWWAVRCLKYTGDDAGREPRAASFHLDWLMEPYGIKAFRTMIVGRESGQWFALPALGEASPQLEIVFPSDPGTVEGDFRLVLAWAQPWCPKQWNVFKSRKVSPDEILAHNIAWADHVRELEGLGQLSGNQLRDLEARLRARGVGAHIDAAAKIAPLTRSVHSKARVYAAWLRGTQVSQSTERNRGS